MTQDAVVLKRLDHGMAEVSVVRGTACGGNCGSCESCMYENEFHIQAINRINALPGQKVIIETESAQIYKAEFLAYILPLVLLVIGYLIAMAFGAVEGIRILFGFLAMMIGAIILSITQKGKKGVTNTIVRYKGDDLIQ